MKDDRTYSGSIEKQLVDVSADTLIELPNGFNHISYLRVLIQDYTKANNIDAATLAALLVTLTDTYLQALATVNLKDKRP